MLFRNYSNRHLSYGHLSRKKQRWDASTNYDSISTEDEDDDKEEDTANCGGTSIQWNRRRLPNQWRRRSTLEDHSDEESSSDTGEISFSLDNDGEEEEGDDIISIQAQRQLSPVAAAAQDNTSEIENTVSPWGNKCKAKQAIWRELDDKDSSIHLMTKEQIHQKWASMYPWKRFKNNFEAMKTQKRVYYNDDDFQPWKTRSSTSDAHDLLVQLFMDREKTKVHLMTAEQLRDSHECFQPYEITAFKTLINIHLNLQIL